MKRTPFFLLLFFAHKLFAQNVNIDSSAKNQDTILPTTQLVSLDSISKRRNELNKTNMEILAGWAAVNIVQSSISASNAKDVDKAFFQMNTYWNIVNLGIAGFGLYSVKKAMNKKITLKENVLAQNKLEKLLLLNTGLDVGYVFAGLYMNERGQRLGNEQTQGFGKSITLQGSFLLVFDIVQYCLHRGNGRELQKWMDKVDIGIWPNGVGIAYKL
jgi:hypothetical protein